MQTKPLPHNSCKIAQLVCISIVAIVHANAIAGTTSENVYIRAEITQDGANAYTVTLFQNTAFAPATTLVLFLMLDSNATLLPYAAYQYAQLMPAQQESGFLLADTWHTTADNIPGKTCLAVAIYSTNGTDGLLPGALLSFTLQLDDRPTAVQIESATKETPLFIDNTPFFSSAAARDTKELPVTFEPQTIVPNCEPPLPPKQFHASWRYRKKIILTWTAPDSDNVLEYRIYRSITDDIAEAISINETWSTALTWTDFFDEDTINAPPAGCSSTAIRYYYWIRSRNPKTGCVSDFNATPVRGTALNW